MRTDSFLCLIGSTMRSSQRLVTTTRRYTRSPAAAAPSMSGDGGVAVYFGTMTFGWSEQTSSVVDTAVAREMLPRYAAAGGVRLDTARIYAGGKTEAILGAVLGDGDGVAAPWLIGTKAHPSQPGGLSDRGLRDQLDASLDALGVDRRAATLCIFHAPVWRVMMPRWLKPNQARRVVEFVRARLEGDAALTAGGRR